jgi:hypothetical protein
MIALIPLAFVGALMYSPLLKLGEEVGEEVGRKHSRSAIPTEMPVDRVPLALSLSAKILGVPLMVTSLVGMPRLTENLACQLIASSSVNFSGCLSGSKGDGTYREPLEARQLRQWHRPQYGGYDVFGTEIWIAPQLQAPLMDSAAIVMFFFSRQVQLPNPDLQ